MKKYGYMFPSFVYLLHNAGITMSLIYTLDEARPPTVLFGFVVCALVSLCVFFKRLMWLLVPWCAILIWAMSKEFILRDGHELMIAAIGLVALSAVFVCMREFRTFSTVVSWRRSVTTLTTRSTAHDNHCRKGE